MGGRVGGGREVGLVGIGRDGDTSAPDDEDVEEADPAAAAAEQPFGPQEVDTDAGELLGLRTTYGLLFC